VNGKALLVTGSGRGIGAATALLAGLRGYAVCINYLHNRNQAESVARRIDVGGGQAIVVQADIAVESEVLRLFETIDLKFGPISALVNNAGILGRVGRLDALEMNWLRRVVDVNLIGAVLCSREAVRRMSTGRGGKGGVIVNVSSVAADHGGANQWLAYAATKGAINTFTVGLAREVAAEGIRVNAVSPGLIETESRAEADRLEQLAPSVPARRIGSPTEVAEAILWLLSGESAYTIGTIISVAGGR
jgi:NAD(P)-dependent dehydrogenase (short-subunit alcohol dehydrogenase family)